MSRGFHPAGGRVALPAWRDDHRTRRCRHVPRQSTRRGTLTTLPRGTRRARGTSFGEVGEELFGNSAHTELYAASLGIDFEDAHLHDLADSDNRQWVFDEAVGELGDMDKAILLDSYIYKSSKVYHVADGALQDHAC